MSRHGRAQVVVVGLKALVLALVLAGGVAAVAPANPIPTIDDILGVYEVKWSETLIDSHTGMKGTNKGEATITISQQDTNVVKLQWAYDGVPSNADLAYYYNAGVLVGGSSDDVQLGTRSHTLYAQVSGKMPGLKMAALYMGYDGNVYDGKFSAKRIP